MCSYVITPRSPRSWRLGEGLGQSEGRVMDVIFIECCVIFLLALQDC